MRSSPEAGFRPLRVLGREVESSVITSFRLAPVDGAPLPPFRPGQYLTLTLEGEPGGPRIRRHYSLSGDPGDGDTWRISVKREGSPAGRSDLPRGLASNWLHDRVAEGDVLHARGPDGGFVLDETSARPVLLLSGGVGQTPLVSMAHALARSERASWFIHACEHGGVHALDGEIRALAARNRRLTRHVLYRVPRPGDRVGDTHDGEGLINRALLQRLLPLDDYEAYLCGPPGFMQAVYDLLVGLGLREERIRYEFFGPATVLRPSGPTLAPAAAPAVRQAGEGGEGPLVTFSASGMSARWDPKQVTLLDFAESLGLSPPFSCRAGICSTCQCTLEAGEVEYVTEPLDPPPAGTVLACCARPRGDVTLAL